jgi:hypothetical protein
VAHWAVVLTHSPAGVYTDPSQASIVADMSMTLDG